MARRKREHVVDEVSFSSGYVRCSCGWECWDPDPAEAYNKHRREHGLTVRRDEEDVA